MHRGLLVLALASAGAACVGSMSEPDGTSGANVGPEVPAFAPAVGGLRRLSVEQYQSSLRDLIGPEIVLPTRIEPDRRIEGLASVGSSIANTSKRGVEQYVAASYDVATQAMADDAVRARLVTCTPTATVDDACAEQFVTAFGARAYRRPLEATEVAALVDVAGEAASTLGDFHDGLVYAMAAILQSPSFLYRAEVGEDDPANPGLRRYDGYELAARVSFFLWNAAPDQALIDAAASGALLTDDGLGAEVERMLADERARDGVRAFFTDMLHLADLDRLNKDPDVFVHFSAELGAIARQETLAVIEDHVVDQRADYRDLLTTRTTFLDRKLASIYGVPAPSLEGFQRFEFPSDSLRRGILGHVSFLALNSHAASSSAVRRGQFVREVLLCGSIPAPPANANTAIPEPTDEARTLRDRVLIHFQNPTCRGCHQLMDPVGLAFENFDGIGRFRTIENGALIDPSGSINGRYFADASELGEVLHDHPDVPRCLVRTMYRYATGHVEVQSETSVLARLEQAFADQGFDVLSLMRTVVLDPGFRTASPPDTTPEQP